MSLWTKSYDVTIQMKALCLFFHMMLFVCQILENDIWMFSRNLPLATFGCERVKKLPVLFFIPILWCTLKWNGSVRIADMFLTALSATWSKYRRHLLNTVWNISFKKISTGRTNGSILLLSEGFIAAKIAPKYSWGNETVN